MKPTASISANKLDLEVHEKTVVGTLLAHSHQIDRLDQMVKPKMFLNGEAKAAAQVLWAKWLEGEQITPLIVDTELAKMGFPQGMAYELLEYSEPREAVSFGLLIAESYLRREKSAIYSDASIRLREGDDVGMVDSETELALEVLTNEFTEKKPDSEAEHQVILDKIKARMKNPHLTSGIETDWAGWDKLTGCWQLTDHVVIGGRPAMGKTTFALQIVKAACEQGVKEGWGVAIFTLEMSTEQIRQKLLSMVSGIPYKRMRKEALTPDEFLKLQAAMATVDTWNLFIEDSLYDIYQITDKLRKWNRSTDIRMTMYDYMGLMSVKGMEKSSRNDQLTVISRELKKIAASKQVNCVNIALSQLSRAVENRGGSKRPQMSDLRDSGSVEQDADMIIFPYRPEYYEILEDEEGNSLKGVMEPIIAKNRDDAEIIGRQPYLKWDQGLQRLVEDNDDFAGLDDSPEYNQPPPNIIQSRATPGDDDEIPF